jgi:2-keto-myo-inositol isomerase
MTRSEKMIDKKRFALNRIIAPGLTLAEFFALTKGIGLSKVELRNDIRDGQVLDGLVPLEVKKMAADQGIEILSINALQKFNLATARVKAKDELARLLETCGVLSCPAVVLCPNNEAADRREAAVKAKELIESLNEFGPMFVKAGISGYIEPLGFGISSLASLAEAKDAIRKSGFACYKVLVDTFHNYIGPEGHDIFGSSVSVGDIGLVHVSGVEESIPKSSFTDAHRIMPGPKDVMDSKSTLLALEKLGYKGNYSFEPFSGKVQNLGPKELADVIEKSIEYLSNGGSYVK